MRWKVHPHYSVQLPRIETLPPPPNPEKFYLLATGSPVNHSEAKEEVCDVI